MGKPQLAEGEERMVALPEGTKSFLCLDHMKRALEICNTPECLSQLNAQCEFAERLVSLMIDHLLRPDEAWDLCKGDVSRLGLAMQQFSPYCCHLGETKLEVFYTLIRDRGFGRAGHTRIGYISKVPTAQLPTSFPKDVM